METEELQQAIARGMILVRDRRVRYNIKQARDYNWNDPEERVRANSIAFLIIRKGYPPNRIRTEVAVPRRTPSDLADIVVYKDDQCKEPFLVVETKAKTKNERLRAQAIEQGFGNANSLRAPYLLFDDGHQSVFFDVAGAKPLERKTNILGTRNDIPPQYGKPPSYRLVAGSENDIKSVSTHVLESKIRLAHSIIWAGGRRDPLTSFDAWSKLLFAKVADEKETPTGKPRRFQAGTNETDTTIATRVRGLFEQAIKNDPSIFFDGAIIELPDNKIASAVRALEDVSFIRSDVDTIGAAFEHFFGSVFRGELGQYFTRRELARFAIGILGVSHDDFVIDLTAGSGGFLLEVLLQVWHSIDQKFSGQKEIERERLKIDFALHRVYGIEIHDILARICKINLLLHHDGHTNIEGGRSCLDLVFSLPRLNPPSEKFTVVVGNPPFGDDVEAGDEDHLGKNELGNFLLAKGRDNIASEQVIIERAVQILEPGGKFALVVPDGTLNNQGELSNCPQTREFLAMTGKLFAVVSLPDHAFRKSGAQNKTSILFFQKYSRDEKRRFDRAHTSAVAAHRPQNDCIVEGLKSVPYQVFLAEANEIGYTPSGASAESNELYKSDQTGRLHEDYAGTILREYRVFARAPDKYKGSSRPGCMALTAVDLWQAHRSHRLDPKYHLFKLEERLTTPTGWVRARLGQIMRRRDTVAEPEKLPNNHFAVMTLSQTGEIRQRAAGKGRNPPEWLGMYFLDSPSNWFAARTGDVVYSSIDLWKGCIAVVPQNFNGALVTKEFPIYEVINKDVDPEFLSILLRSRFYQRAFRAITTGHSNRRRTQQDDFENLEIYYPKDLKEQRRLIRDILGAKRNERSAKEQHKKAAMKLSDLIDGRGCEELPAPAPEDEEE